MCSSGTAMVHFHLNHYHLSLKQQGAENHLHQFPSSLWLLFLSIFLSDHLSTYCPLSLYAFLSCTHMRECISACLLSVPHEQRVTELSELTNDSPLHSHLPPLITHPHFLTASLTLFVFPSPHLFYSRSLNLAAFFVLAPIKRHWLTRKIAIYSLLPRQTMTAEHNSCNNGFTKPR